MSECAGRQAELVGQGSIGWFDQDGSIGEYDGRDAAHAAVRFQHELLAGLIYLDVDPLEADVVLAEETSRPAAIAAPIRAIDGDHARGHKGISRIAYWISLKFTSSSEGRGERW